MADSTIPTNAVTNPGGPALDAERLPAAGPSGEDIYRERVQITGAVLAEIARVLNSNPGLTAYGLVTRSIPANLTGSAPTAVSVGVVGGIAGGGIG